jgi:hypothetical protein
VKGRKSIEDTVEKKRNSETLLISTVGILLATCPTSEQRIGNWRK